MAKQGSALRQKARIAGKEAQPIHREKIIVGGHNGVRTAAVHCCQVQSVSGEESQAVPVLQRGGQSVRVHAEQPDARVSGQAIYKGSELACQESQLGSCTASRPCQISPERRYFTVCDSAMKFRL